MLKIRKTFKYRLWPSRKQRESLRATLEVCRDLYNDALQERRDAWKTCRQSVSFEMQSAQLPACKEADVAMQGVYSQVLQDVLHRVDKTYKAFFRRGSGWPRFRGKGRFDSFTYPQLGFSLQGTQLSLSKIGNIKVKLHRSLQGEVKTLTLKQENGKWYACFSCLVDAEPLPECTRSIGIDVGLESFAVTSDAEIVDNPRWFRRPRGNCAASSATCPAAPRGVRVGAGRAGGWLSCTDRYSTNATISSTSCRESLLITMASSPWKI